MQFVVSALLRQQGFMIPLFNDLAMIEHHDAVRFSDRRQAMSDNESGPMGH